MAASTTSDRIAGALEDTRADAPRVHLVDATQAHAVADVESRRELEAIHCLLIEIRDELRLFNARSSQ